MSPQINAVSGASNKSFKQSKDLIRMTNSQF